MASLGLQYFHFGGQLLSITVTSRLQMEGPMRKFLETNIPKYIKVNVNSNFLLI